MRSRCDRRERIHGRDWPLFRPWTRYCLPDVAKEMPYNSIEERASGSGWRNNDGMSNCRRSTKKSFKAVAYDENMMPYH